ncbi:hypothetical protein AWU67_00925 [Microterricola viridarii]|uniref:Uncharacterized protein n=1 Tax=Microterricola viridarii TaxID=412690 RepID=A0A0Y0N5E0_9MICO|nr:hypothetical protein AWU67_00925 [Microterricola viridarii]
MLLIMVAGAMTFALSGLRKSAGDANWNAASAAAFAGVDEYRSRLAADSSYYRYGNPAAAFSSRTGSLVDLPSGTAENFAFGVGAAGTWAQVPGSTVAQYRYEVDNSEFATSGILRIRSTGRVGDSVRSVVANLKAKGFIDFLYFTDYEVQDPGLSLDSSGNPNCKNLKYAWVPDSAAAPKRVGCTEITFSNNDKIAGPAHSNDTMHICKAQFTMKVTSSNPNAPHYSPTNGVYPDLKSDGTPNKNPDGSIKMTGGGNCSDQTFNPAYPPSFDDTVLMPAKNTEMQLQTRVDMPVEVPRPGCQYTGPTSITLNADGTITVRSPWTKFAHAGTETVAAGVIVPNCGTPGTAAGRLGSATGQTIPVPENNLIFVQGVPAGAVGSDPNAWGTTKPTGGGYSCTRSDGAGADNGNGIGYPLVTGTGSNTRVETTMYGCKDGDVFLQGTLKGRLTVAAANAVYIVADIKYAGGVTTNTDMLGIVGGKPVWVWNPAYNDGSNLKLMKSGSDRTIHAAILSVENTFQVQNYNVGSSLGNLIVYGAIAQKFRGIVSQGGGYVKKYTYDERFKTTAPPKFLAPVATTYGVTTTADVAPAFRTDGTVIPLP